MLPLASLLRPTKAKLALALALALLSYATLMLTKDTYDIPTLILSDGQDGTPGITAEMGLGVQFNSLVLVFLFPLSSLLMALFFGGFVNNLACDSAGSCALASGTSPLYLGALVLNFPYYYWLASLAATAYVKIVKEEKA